MEDKFDWEEHGLMTDKELDEIDENLKRSEVEGVQNILKYFDRIHDKLFTFNNILIGGYFVLSQIYDSFSIYGIIIPLINLAILLFIEYRMMEKSRFEADIRKKTPEEIKSHGISINKTNLYSLFAFVTTAIVLGIFIYNVFTISNNNSKEIIKTKVEEVFEKNIDTISVDTSSIAIIPFDTTYHWLFKGAKQTELNASELKKIERMLTDSLMKYNSEQRLQYEEISKKYPNETFSLSNFIIELDKYKRQYIPVINEQGEKEVWINCFCGNWGEIGKTEILEVEDGGNCYFNLKINLTTKTIYDIMVNGDA